MITQTIQTKSTYLGKCHKQLDSQHHTAIYWAKSCYGDIILHEMSVLIVKMADHDGNLKSLAEKNVSIALILPRRWQDGAESLGMETTSSLYKCPTLSLNNLLHTTTTTLRTAFPILSVFSCKIVAVIMKTEKYSKSCLTQLV